MPRTPALEPHFRDILLVDGNESRRKILAARLRMYEEFHVVEAGMLEVALTQPEPGRYDAVVAESGLPDCPPPRLCRVLESHGFTGAIVILDDVCPDDLVEECLDAGAIDCQPHALAVPVLTARLRAHMRSRDRMENVPKLIGPLVLHPAQRSLVNNATRRRAHLTEKEMIILRALARTPERVVPREALLNTIWNVSTGVETHTVETHVYRLRRKLSDVAGASVRIRTAPRGYCLVRAESPETPRPARTDATEVAHYQAAE